MTEPAQAAEWMAQWRAAGPALAEVHRRELAEMTDEQALAASEAFLALATTVPLPEARLRSSGLVEQQRLFGTARRQ